MRVYTITQWDGAASDGQPWLRRRAGRVVTVVALDTGDRRKARRIVRVARRLGCHKVAFRAFQR